MSEIITASAVRFNALPTAHDGYTLLYKDNKVCRSDVKLSELVGDTSAYLTEEKANTLYQGKGDYLSASTSANFYPMTGNPSGFLTTHQPISADDWNSCYETVSANSGIWGSEYDWTAEINAASANAVNTTSAYVSANYYNIEEINDFLDEKYDISSFAAVSGTFQEKLTFAGENNIITAINASAVGAGGGASYEAGQGIKIDNNVISINTNGTANNANMAFAIGVGTIATEYASHAEGRNTSATDTWTHAEGSNTIAKKYGSHAEGANTSALGSNSHTEGNWTVTSGDSTHAEGSTTSAIGNNSHAEGFRTLASGYASHAEGNITVANGSYSHAEGEDTSAIGDMSHAEGKATKANNVFSHSEGYYTLALGAGSHAEGIFASASGDYSHAEGFRTISNNYDHAEGGETSALDSYSHAEGQNTIASGTAAHAEGQYTSAMQQDAHAEGMYTLAQATLSHSEGNSTSALSLGSHTEGYSTIAGTDYMHVGGTYNKTSADALYVIGNGTADDARSDAFIIYPDGSVSAQGKISANGVELGAGGGANYSYITVNMPNITPSYDFNYVQIGNQKWMNSNLTIDDGGSGISAYTEYTNYQGNIMIMRNLYTYGAAKRIADSIPGWHLPTYDEVRALFQTLGDVWVPQTTDNYQLLGSKYGKKLKSQSAWHIHSPEYANAANGTDDYGFNCCPMITSTAIKDNESWAESTQILCNETEISGYPLWTYLYFNNHDNLDYSKTYDYVTLNWTNVSNDSYFGNVRLIKDEE